MLALTIFLRRWWPYLLLAFVLNVGLAGFLVWLHRRDEAIRRDARREERLAASAALVVERSHAALRAMRERRIDSVTVVRRLALVRRDTLWRSDTVYVAGDTTPRYAVPIGTITRHDSAFAACDRLSSSCAREQVAKDSVIVELRRSLALARTGYAIPPPARTCTTPAIAAGVLGAIVGHVVR